MIKLHISPYTLADDKAALELEKKCIQGKSLALSFVRSSFHARSEVYENYKIFCAKSNGELVGIFAAANKKVILAKQSIQSLYFYDCRIHPRFRNQGIAKRLTETLVDYFGSQIDCYYTFIAGQNQRALELAIKGFGAKVVIPLKYIILPVYREYRIQPNFNECTFDTAFFNYMNHQPKPEFFPDINKDKMPGYVKSYTVGNKAASTSIWTNEKLLNERVENIPLYFQLYKIFSSILKPFKKMPHIPSKKEILKSWFLFNLHGEKATDMENLLKHVNNQALENGKKFIYLLIPDNNPIVNTLKKISLRHFELPYVFLAKGVKRPNRNDNIFLDIRDL